MLIARFAITTYHNRSTVASSIKINALHHLWRKQKGMVYTMDISVATIMLPTGIVSAIGLVCGLGLAVASKLFAVKEDERIELIREVLPGANCGACGCAGCDDYARAVCEGTAEPNKCIPGGAATLEGINRILGTDAQAGQRMLAIVACTGRKSITGKRYEYKGLPTCSAANLLHAGGGKCQYGCIGFGDCVRGCPFDAIHLEEGVAVVDRSVCTGCGVCVDTCPKALISLIEDNDSAFVTCSNKSKGAVAMKVCEESCIGCMRCVKACDSDAITVKDNLAFIDTVKCTNCGACIAVCPRKTISYISHQTGKIINAADLIPQGIQ